MAEQELARNARRRRLRRAVSVGGESGQSRPPWARCVPWAIRLGAGVDEYGIRPPCGPRFHGGRNDVNRGAGEQRLVRMILGKVDP